MLNGIAWFFLYGHYKLRRRGKEKKDVKKLIQRKNRSVMISGWRPCLHERGVWHEGVCTDLGCPSLNKPKMGAPSYANR